MAKEVIQPHGGKLNQFEKGDRGNPNGRPPNKTRLFNSYIKEATDDGLELVDDRSLNEAIRYLLSIPLSQVIEIAGSPDEENHHPAAVRILANRMLSKREGLQVMNMMLDRSMGKVKSAIEFSGEVTNKSNLDSLSVEQRMQILEWIEATKK